MRKTDTFLKELRENMGYTQEHFAQMLKVSRSHMAMAEVGRRTLPGASYVILAKLFTDFDALEKGALANYRSLETKLFVNHEYRKVLPAMELKERSCRQQAKQLKEKLADMKKRARDSENWIIVITRFIDEIKQDSSRGREVEWLHLLKGHSYDRLLTCWEPEQAKIHIKIEALVGEARALRRYRMKVKRAIVE
jgi:transcriptional regulator with XRE-family HTH domain